MSIRSVLTVACLVLVPALAEAQPPPPMPVTPSAQPQPRRPEPQQPKLAIEPPATPEGREVRVVRREGQPINVRVDLTLTDQRGGAAPIKKTVSVVVADGHAGFIRSSSEINGVGSVPLNIDAEPQILADGKVRLGINVQYDLPSPPEALSNISRGTALRTAVHENLALILESGKSMIAAQSADPLSDRQVVVEVKATVMR